MEGVIVTARELAAASTDDILGKKPKKSEGAKSAAQDGVETEEEPVKEQAINAAAPPVPVPEPKVPDNTAPAPRRPLMPLKKKPIAVASAPAIGNYQLPAIDFLQLPDTNVKPTESKEELMANARLMQNTLAQFDIEVAMGDITKGPTITRYELHPAPASASRKSPRSTTTSPPR